MTTDNNTVKRWTARRRSALILSILRGEVSTQEAARKHGLTVKELEEWKERFLSGAENALRSRPPDDAAQHDAEVKRLKQKIGDLVMDLDILKEGMRGHPLADGCSTSESRPASGLRAPNLPSSRCFSKRNAGRDR